MALAIPMRFAELLVLPLLLSAGTTSADLLRQAEERIQKEQFSTAQTLLEQTIRQEPDNVDALYRLGYVQYRQRKLSQARDSFAKVVKVAPPAADLIPAISLKRFFFLTHHRLGGSHGH